MGGEGAGNLSFRIQFLNTSPLYLLASCPGSTDVLRIGASLEDYGHFFVGSKHMTNRMGLPGPYTRLENEKMG